MPQNLKSWDPDEWQKHVDLLLRLRHGHQNFVPVPDKHGGDFGIEAFTLGGMAYQAYAPEEPLSTKKLHEKQRDKINRDINKFIKNKDALSKLFGDTIISRWVLVTPRYESAPLAQYITGKTNEVRKANLPYVAQDFSLLIHTEEDFAVERKKLVDAGLEKIRIESPVPDSKKNDDWLDKKITLIENLERKIKKMAPNVKKKRGQIFA